MRWMLFGQMMMTRKVWQSYHKHLVGTYNQITGPLQQPVRFVDQPENTNVVSGMPTFERCRLRADVL